MNLSDLRPPAGQTHSKKRVGRGMGSGLGKTSGKGHKGIKARTGHHGPGGGKPQFEGGQMPLTRRIPKRGFTNIFRVENQVVGFEDLAKLPKGAEVTEETLAEAGLIRKGKGPAKLLANGDAAKGVTVRGVKMSAGARQKIESAGGRVEN